MESTAVKKIAANAVILLFIGVAVTPSINSTADKESEANNVATLTSLGPGVCDARINVVPQMKMGEPLKPFQMVSEGATMFHGNRPTVASDTLGNVIMGFEDLTTSEVWFASSEDFGGTWSVDIAIPGVGEFPDIDSCGDGKFIGSMVQSDEPRMLCWILIESDEYQPFWWDFTENIQSVAVAGFPDDMGGSLALVCDGKPVYFYQGYQQDLQSILSIKLKVFPGVNLQPMTSI